MYRCGREKLVHRLRESLSADDADYAQAFLETVQSANANRYVPIREICLICEICGEIYLGFLSSVRAFALSSSISLGLLAGSESVKTLSRSFLASSLLPFF